MAGNSVDSLLVQLISTWSGWETSDWYVETLAPAIVQNHPDLALLPAEQKVVDALRAALDPEQFERLPSMLRECMSSLRADRELRDQLARDRPRAERERRAQEYQERQAADLEARKARDLRAREAAALERRDAERSRLLAQENDALEHFNVPYWEPQNLAGRKVAERDIRNRPHWRL